MEEECSQEAQKKRKGWPRESMAQAVAAVRKKEMGYLKASTTYNVPKRTLIRYVKDPRPINEVINIKLGRKPVLPPELERSLVAYM